MAHRVSRQYEQRPHSDGSESFLGLNDSILGRMDQTREALLNGITAFQQETLDFVNRRLERDADLVRHCQQCRNMVEVMAAQQKWLAHTSEDYMREWLKLAKMMGTPAARIHPEADRGQEAQHIREPETARAAA